MGPTLSLISHYFKGYKVSWPGAFIGLFEGGLAGFALGAIIAYLRNWDIKAYEWLVMRRSAAKSRRDFLDKV